MLFYRLTQPIKRRGLRKATINAFRCHADHPTNDQIVISLFPQVLELQPKSKNPSIDSPPFKGRR